MTAPPLVACQRFLVCGRPLPKTDPEPCKVVITAWSPEEINEKLRTSSIYKNREETRHGQKNGGTVNLITGNIPALVRLGFTGVLISFLGTLPLGTLNLLAAKMAVADGIGPAIWFSLGVLIVEMVYVRLSLVAMDWIRRQRKWLHLLERLTVTVILLLAAGSFWAAAHPAVHSAVDMGGILHREGKSALGFTRLSSAPLTRLLTGMLLSAINPLQIPFWFGWSTVLQHKRILQPRNDHYNVYIAGIGLGTFAGNAVFIFGGRILLGTLGAHEVLVNTAIGIVFSVTAIRQLIRRPTYRGRPD